MIKKRGCISELFILIKRLLVKSVKIDVYCWMFLADTYAKIKDNQKAVECYEQALKISPKDDSMWFQLGFIYDHEMKNYSKAIECYTKAIELIPIINPITRCADIVIKRPAIKPKLRQIWQKPSHLNKNFSQILND